MSLKVKNNNRRHEVGYGDGEEGLNMVQIHILCMKFSKNRQNNIKKESHSDSGLLSIDFFDDLN